MKSAAALIAWIGLLALTANAGIVKGPYLQDARVDRITVAAETDAGETCSVEWDQDFSKSVLLTAEGNHHEGAVQGIAHSTCYPYRLRCGDQVSPEASFCGAPSPDEPFSFVVFGDTRSDHAAHESVIDAILAEGVDFYINTGDLVSDGAEETDWATYFGIEGALMRDTPMYPTVGNHDETGGEIDNYGRLFAIPQEHSDTERYYAFTYGNSRFIVLDNQSIGLGRPVDHTTQGDWFADQLREVSADPAVAHTHVFVHENMYTVDEGRSGDEGLRLWQNDILAAGVEVVWSGHDHHYARGQAGNGLPFVVTGGGGAGLYEIKPELITEGQAVDALVWGWLPMPGDKPFTVHWSRMVHHYVRVDVQGERVEACAKEVTGGTGVAGIEFDCFTLSEPPDPEPEIPDKKSGGCSTASPSGTGAPILLFLLLFIFRRRTPR